MSIPDQGNPLRAAQRALGQAAGQLRTFHARQGEYVSAGHRALVMIDEALAALGRARQILVGELRDDQDERAERVDRLIAESRERFGPHDEADEAGSGPGGEPR